VSAEYGCDERAGLTQTPRDDWSWFQVRPAEGSVAGAAGRDSPHVKTHERRFSPETMHEAQRLLGNRTAGLDRRQKFSSHRPRSVTMRTRSRTMPVDSRWFAGNDAEQSAKVVNQFVPCFRRNSESLKQPSKLLRCGARFIQTLLTSRPVQQ
jgi:hypothetical protein